MFSCHSLGQAWSSKWIACWQVGPDNLAHSCWHKTVLLLMSGWSHEFNVVVDIRLISWLHVVGHVRLFPWLQYSCCYQAHFMAFDVVVDVRLISWLQWGRWWKADLIAIWLLMSFTSCQADLIASMWLLINGWLNDFNVVWLCCRCWGQQSMWLRSH